MTFKTFEIEELKGYTYISKYIFRDRNLSLKAMGLLALSFSLPETWVYTEAGLAAINNDGIDSIKGAVKELKKKEYLEITRERNEKGYLGNSIFKFYLMPYSLSRETEPEYTEIQTDDENTNVRIEDVPVSIMSNYHLRDRSLSLKAKGLLSLMFSLPKNWVFSEKNIASLCNDGITSVHTAIEELSEKKYLSRERIRDEKGHMGASLYTVYRMPYDIKRTLSDNESQEWDKPEVENPILENPPVDNPPLESPLYDSPLLEKPTLENPTQTNTIKTKTIKNKNDISINYHPEINKTSQSESETRKMIEERIGFSDIISFNEELETKLADDEITAEEFEKEIFHEVILGKVIDVMTDIYRSKSDEIQAGQGTLISKQRLISKFESFSRKDIKEIIDRVKTAKPKNQYGYILAVIKNY